MMNQYMASFYHSFVYSLVLLFAIQSSCLAAKFAMISMRGRSHYMVHERLGRELVTRGHEVNYVYSITKYESMSDTVNSISLVLNYMSITMASGGHWVVNFKCIVMSGTRYRTPVMQKGWISILNSLLYFMCRINVSTQTNKGIGNSDSKTLHITLYFIYTSSTTSRGIISCYMFSHGFQRGQITNAILEWL